MVGRPPSPNDRNYDQEVVMRAERQDVVTPAGQVVEQDVTVSELVDNVEARRSSANWLAGLIYTLFGIVEILIALRVLLSLIAADRAAGFSRFIYGVTGPFVAPFNGIVGEPAASNGSVFEVPSVLAIIVYLILSWIIVRILQLVIDRPSSGVSATRTAGRRNLM